MIFTRNHAKKSSSGAAPQILTLDKADGWFPASKIAMSRDRAMKLSVVNRCVELRATSMAMLPVYVMNERTKERLPEHRLGRVLWNQPNEYMTWFDYARLMQCNEDFTGNAYAWINRDLSSGHVVELIPLPPDHVTPYFDPTARLWYIYTNPRTGEMMRFDPIDILHYKAYSTDGITGISILKRAAQTISNGLAAQKYQSDMYNNACRPSGVLTVETDIGGMTPDPDDKTKLITRKELIRKEWDKIHSGPGNGFRVAILDNGMKYQSIAMSNADAQFVESEDLRVADICRFFGVSLHLVYAGKQSYASNEQNSIELSKFTLQPLVTRNEHEDSRKLLLPSERRGSLRVKREMKALLRADATAQAAWYREMAQMGVYSINEIRSLEDLPAVNGGDNRYASLNYAPLELWPELSERRAEQYRSPS